ncbi:hypothetical protein QQ045_014917 [Rhodiola kirilowii]
MIVLILVHIPYGTMARSSSSGEKDFHVEQRTTKKTKRDSSLMLDMIRRHREDGTKITVEFDAKGYPIGNAGDTWRSYLGVVVRTRIPIEYTNWRKVPQTCKDVMWNEATVIYSIIPLSYLFLGPDTRKEQEVKYASSAWRNFKTRLAKDYIFGKRKDEDPTKEYKFIDSSQWKKFVEHRLSEDAKKLSAQNTTLAAKNEYGHTMSRGGYRKVKEVLINEKIADLIVHVVIEEGETPSISVERYEDQLVERSNQGFFSPHGRHDILTEAIGMLEYPGRTKGVGTHVPWMIWFPKSTSSRTTPSSSTSRVEMPDRLGRHCHVNVDPRTSVPEDGLKSVLFIEGVLEGEG